MLKIVSICLFLRMVLSTSSSSTAEPRSKPCKNFGVKQPDGRCRCFLNYAGKLCDTILRCTDDTKVRCDPGKGKFDNSICRCKCNGRWGNPSCNVDLHDIFCASKPCDLGFCADQCHISKENCTYIGKQPPPELCRTLGDKGNDTPICQNTPFDCSKCDNRTFVYHDCPVACGFCAAQPPPTRATTPQTSKAQPPTPSAAATTLQTSKGVTSVTSSTELQQSKSTVSQSISTPDVTTTTKTVLTTTTVLNVTRTSDTPNTGPTINPPTTDRTSESSSSFRTTGPNTAGPVIHPSPTTEKPNMDIIIIGAAAGGSAFVIIVIVVIVVVVICVKRKKKQTKDASSHLAIINNLSERKPKDYAYSEVMEVSAVNGGAYSDVYHTGGDDDAATKNQMRSFMVSNSNPAEEYYSEAMKSGPMPNYANNVVQNRKSEPKKAGFDIFSKRNGSKDNGPAEKSLKGNAKDNASSTEKSSTRSNYSLANPVTEYSLATTEFNNKPNDINSVPAPNQYDYVSDSDIKAMNNRDTLENSSSVYDTTHQPQRQGDNAGIYDSTYNTSSNDYSSAGFGAGAAASRVVNPADDTYNVTFEGQPRGPNETYATMNDHGDETYNHTFDTGSPSNEYGTIYKESHGLNSGNGNIDSENPYNALWNKEPISGDHIYDRNSNGLYDQTDSVTNIPQQRSDLYEATYSGVGMDSKV